MRYIKKYMIHKHNLLKLFLFLISPIFCANCHAQSNKELKNSGQVIAKSGETITGLNIINPSGPCIVLQQVSRVTIIGNQIGPCGKDPNYDVGIFIYQSHNLQIINNHFHDISSAIYALENQLGKLLVEGNHATQIKGPFPRGQLVQLDKYSGPEIILRCNISDQAIGGYLNIDGRGGPEDHINIYKSSGTAISPIMIINNKIRGGGSLSGGGIIAVDGGQGGNVIIKNNILIDPGQYGIAIPSGNNIEITGNQIFGNQKSWTNVGIYVWNQYKNTVCSDNRISNNQINYINKKGVSNPYWDSGNCGEINLFNNTLKNLAITQKTWDINFSECRKSLKR